MNDDLFHKIEVNSSLEAIYRREGKLPEAEETGRWPTKLTAYFAYLRMKL